MNSTRHPCHAIRASRHHQGGMALFTALILLFVLTLSGILLARMQMGEERMAQNDDNHQIAVEAAEATLRYAESNLQLSAYGDPAFAANSNGLYTLDPVMGGRWTTPKAPNPGVTTLTYAGPPLPVPTAPSFIIEKLPSVCGPGCSVQTAGRSTANVSKPRSYRITAASAGGDQSASATLQSIVSVH